MARHLGVTPRYVDRLFETEGESFSGFVRGQRLMRAHHMLMDPHCAGRSIGTIASDVGFADVSEFGCAFRRRFGSTPAELRSRAQHTDE